MELRAVVLSVVVVFVCTCVRVDGCSDTACVAGDGRVCEGRGVCDCGVCLCEAGYEGLRCEECPGCAAPCPVYRDCVQCKTFGTGRLGIMDCINQCEFLANYNRLEAAPVGGGAGGMTVCEMADDEGCVFTFKVGASSDGYRDLYIDTELACPVYEPTDSTLEDDWADYTTGDVIEGPDTTTVGGYSRETTAGHTDATTATVTPDQTKKYDVKHKHPKQETPGVVSGSDSVRVSDNLNQRDNGAAIVSVSMATVTLCFLSVIGV